MISEKLSAKLRERKMQLALREMEGISSAIVANIGSEDFSFQNSAIKDKCGIDAQAFTRWNLKTSDQDLISYLSERILRYGRTFFLPFEQPYVIKVTISDFEKFVTSVWRLSGTRDITLYATDPSAVFDLQDLEHDLAYFEILK